jgi:hypothetical protein
LSQGLGQRVDVVDHPGLLVRAPALPRSADHQQDLYALIRRHGSRLQQAVVAPHLQVPTLKHGAGPLEGAAHVLPPPIPGEQNQRLGLHYQTAKAYLGLMGLGKLVSAPYTCKTILIVSTKKGKTTLMNQAILTIIF